MGRKRRRLSRSSDTLEYRPVIVIATEGKETEPAYFKLKIFKPSAISSQIKILPSKCSSSPISVKNRMEKYVKEYGQREGDAFWLVVDRDNWKVVDLHALFSWTQTGKGRFLAVSNPQFEYWLLLHFEDGNNVRTKTECLRKLKSHCPNYNKNNMPLEKFTLDNVKSAVTRARLKDNPPCPKWPGASGTTVYRLVERIIA